MNKVKHLHKKRAQRVARVKAVIRGTAERPRLVVHRTNRYFYAQLIDDVAHRTLLSASNLWKNSGVSKNSGAAADAKMKKGDQAYAVGAILAKKAQERGITRAVFDRRSYQFHGRVQQFAEGAKKGGLKI